MSNGNLRVVARLKAQPGEVDGLNSLLIGLIEPTRKEQGCITFEMHQNNEDPTDFLFFEEWTEDAALVKHFFAQFILCHPDSVADTCSPGRSCNGNGLRAKVSCRFHSFRLRVTGG